MRSVTYELIAAATFPLRGLRTPCLWRGRTPRLCLAWSGLQDRDRRRNAVGQEHPCESRRIALRYPSPPRSLVPPTMEALRAGPNHPHDLSQTNPGGLRLSYQRFGPRSHVGGLCMPIVCFQLVGHPVAAHLFSIVRDVLCVHLSLHATYLDCENNSAHPEGLLSTSCFSYPVAV